MSDLLIRLKRNSDGSTALTCVRPDASSTWQRHERAHAAVLPAHDLTHYAVETALGYTRGFFGLIAEGWDIADFAPPYRRGPVPAEAQEAELIVGVIETERMMGGVWTPEQLREHGRQYVSSARAAQKSLSWPVLSDAEIARVRTVRAELLSRWADLSPGQTLELKLGVNRAVAR